MKQAWGEFALWKSWPGRLVLGVLTYALVNITWVFFRAQDFHNAWRMLGSMLGFGPVGLPILTTWQVISASVPVVAMLAIHVYMRERDLHVEVARWPVALVGLVLGAMLFLIAINAGGEQCLHLLPVLRTPARCGSSPASWARSPTSGRFRTCAPAPPW